jgi:hypothetical protein
MSHRLLVAALALSLATASLGGAVAVDADPATASLPGVLVRLRSDAPRDSAAVLSRAGGELAAEELDLWKLPARSAVGVLRTLRASDSVAFSMPEATYTATVSSATVPDPLVSQEWWRSAIAADGPTPPGPGVPVAIVDSGVYVDHPEFAGRPNLSTLNAQEPQPFGGVHGTSVASVVGAPRNGVGTEGVYPQAVLRSWDSATGSGIELTSSAIVDGILEASRSGKSVINLSLGGPADAAIEAAVEVAVARGSLVVAAAGNEGLEGNPLSYPGALPHVLTVAATQPDGSVAPWSSSSRFVDLAAPGAQIPVATLDPATGIPSWELADGTSFAAPLVAGAAAWIWTRRPSLDAGQVAQILRVSASDIGVAGRDPWSGLGLLNVRRALATAAPAKDPSEPNDDVDAVTPGRDGYLAIPPLTRRVRASTRTSGRVDAAEDPRDVYRVWLPKGKTLGARVSADAGISLELVRSTARSVANGVRSADLLAASESRTPTTAALGYRNPSGGRFALLVVTPKSARGTGYALAVSAR